MPGQSSARQQNHPAKRLIPMTRECFKAAAVTDDVYWVGAVDWNVRNFHGYLTSAGTTYNAYLVLADKITLVDTVKAPFREEMLSRIASVIDPSRIDYIVSNHAEMDHSGCLAEMIEHVQPEKVFASVKGHEALRDHFGLDQAITPVQDGAEISLGNRTLKTLETRMVHWPDSMFSYMPEEQLLFSQDAFGMHLASYERFADQIPQPTLDREAAKYYANIILHLSNFVGKTLGRWQETGLGLETVCPDHGPIWRTGEGIAHIIESYARWAEQVKCNRAVVVYDTMWQSTDKMARAVAEGLASTGTSVKVMRLDVCHRSDVATEILDAGALVVGSPTLNNNIYPTVADTLTYLKGLKPKNIVGGVFGSYGWSGEAPKQLAAWLEQMKIEVVNDPLRAKYVPDEDVYAQCYQLGVDVSQRMQEALAETQPA
jgi:flavorubredoxin